MECVSDFKQVGSTEFGFFKGEQFLDRDAESAGNPTQIPQRGIPSAPFNPAQVRNMDSGPVGNLFLRKATMLTDRTYLCAEGLRKRVHCNLSMARVVRKVGRG